MSISFDNTQQDIKNIKKFEAYLLELLQKYANDSNYSSNVLLTSTSIDQTNVINLNFSSQLNEEQIALLEEAISSYVEPYTEEHLYRTTPCLTPEITCSSTEYTLLHSILYSGYNYNEPLNKLRINSRINTSYSNSHYYLRVVDITNNIIMGSNVFTNTEYTYNTIPLSNIPFDLATIELQGKKGPTSDNFQINGCQIVYTFR